MPYASGCFSFLLVGAVSNRAQIALIYQFKVFSRIDFSKISQNRKKSSGNSGIPFSIFGEIQQAP